MDTAITIIPCCVSYDMIGRDLYLIALFLGMFTQLLNPLNAELNPIRHLLALVGARHIVHVSRIRVN
jgi:hypothetical protein